MFYQVKIRKNSTMDTTNTPIRRNFNMVYFFVFERLALSINLL